ncbi:MAG: hypothetical protein P8N02_03770 [Actinomycetota bacterium]|nr:hypothetical protein [Actinomycetota bacterium]
MRGNHAGPHGPGSERASDLDLAVAARELVAELAERSHIEGSVVREPFRTVALDIVCAMVHHGTLDRLTHPD